jgi:hypothetical protein
MKAIFINAKENQIEPIDLGQGNQAICDRIGYGCNLFELVSVEDNNDGLFCDDEGVFGGHSSEDEHHFGFLWCVSKVKGTFLRYFLICGNAVIIGCDENGDSQDAITSLKEIDKRVLFLSTESIKDYKSSFL